MQKTFFLGLSILFLPFVLSAQLALDVEGNYIASIPYNVVRIPSMGGTEFDLAKDLDVSTKFTYRIRASYTIAKRHVVSGLFAPLTIHSAGTFHQPVHYSEETFEANVATNAVYKFNSYRLTYRYLIVANDKVTFGLGLTGKVRDANITLSQGAKSSDFPDLGVVPLVNFYLLWSPLKKASLLLEGDALASGQGRAEDIFAGIMYRPVDKLGIKAGYRILEGGADVERNYNFTWVNYAALGLILFL
jgi:hypothetical protein